LTYDSISRSPGNGCARVREQTAWRFEKRDKSINQKMKSTKFVVIAVASASLLSLGISAARAQDYRAFVRAISIATNANGGLVYHSYGNGQIIRECAHENGITNLTGLSLVYNRTADALQVVSGTNHTVVCTPLTFAGGTWLSNSNHTKVERLAGVYVESSSTASGTLAATERLAYTSSNTVSFFSLSGQLQYTGSGTNGPVIYKGSIFARSGFGDREDEEEGSESRGW
jgi:hypothetical protein